MKRYIKTNLIPEDLDDVFGMANLDPNKTGLTPVEIWSDHKGFARNVNHSQPRVKLGVDTWMMSISIEPHPQILAESSNIKHSVRRKLNDAIKYVGRNYDLFLKHYNDSDFSFSDEDLFNALRERGEYK